MKTLKIFVFTALFSVVCGNSVDCQSKLRIENLKAFAKVYGYVKYFYPGDEADKIDWDKFAIYGTEKVLKCNSDKELIVTLQNLFSDIAPGVLFYETGKKIKYNSSMLIPKDTGNYKKTFWQHEGVDKGMTVQNVLYKSIRVNRNKIITKPENKSAFGVLTYNVDATEYRGKKIKISASARLSNESMGTGHLWLRIDQPGGKVSFLNNMSNNPITKPNWKGYEIYGSVDSLAVRIYFGAFLVGNGEFNVDDIKLSAGDGKNFTEIPVQYGDFNAESIDELKKVWYSGNQEYKYALINNGIGGKYLSISKTPVRDTLPGSKLFEAEPVFGEVVNEQINNNISCIVPLVLYCNESGTYPAVNAEKFLEKLSATDKNSFGLPLRVADVIIVWNIFQHFYPYMESAGTDWNIELEKALYRCFSDKTEFDFLATLRIMTAALKDGHIHLNYSKDLNYYLPPIAWDIIEGKLVITKVYDESLPLHPGDIVSGIDGKDPVTYFGREAQTISASTSGWLDYRLRSATLFGSKDSKLMITVNNEQLELTRNQTQYIQNLKDNEKAVTFSDLGDGVFYMNMDKADMKIIEGLMPKLTSAKAIICDLRGYPVNSIKFISHLLNKETHTKWMFIPQYIYPDQKRVTGYREFGWDLKPEKPHINAKIIFITDGRAISYAESYIGMIQGNKLAVIIGEPTAGTNGNINPFTLPGGYSTAWTGMKVLKHDGSKLHGVGFLPDIYMSKTIEGVREGRDEFLEKAIKIAKEKL